MVHELLGIDNNRVNVLDASRQKQVCFCKTAVGPIHRILNRLRLFFPLQPMVISSSSDVFFQQNMYANYGERRTH